MLISIIYFITILFSNIIGAISGMGGGVIIKPVLEVLNVHSLTAIAFYSCIAVLTMSLSSTYKQVRNHIDINFGKALSISFGSLIGGFLGDKILSLSIAITNTEIYVQRIQNIIMIITLTLVLLFSKFCHSYFALKKPFLFLLMGIFLGTLSTFLGIGGGPINVAMLIFIFGFSIKQATTYSIITILFSQAAKLLHIILFSDIFQFDLTILWSIVPAALLGGYIGSSLSNKCSDKTIAHIYNLVVFLVILISSYNLFQTF